MTADEAAIIGKILETADSYCSYCAGELADKMKEKFPEFDWRALTGTTSE